MPMIYGGPPSKERESLRLYLYTYLMEAKDRGFPLFRPMAMQYSKTQKQPRAWTNSC
jgi:alpha-glucosidase (family GH31 glycosyl hydrolase)